MSMRLKYIRNEYSKLELTRIMFVNITQDRSKFVYGESKIHSCNLLKAFKYHHKTWRLLFPSSCTPHSTPWCKVGIETDTASSQINEPPFYFHHACSLVQYGMIVIIYQYHLYKYGYFRDIRDLRFDNNVYGTCVCYPDFTVGIPVGFSDRPRAKIHIQIDSTNTHFTITNTT